MGRLRKRRPIDLDEEEEKNSEESTDILERQSAKRRCSAEHLFTSAVAVASISDCSINKDFDLLSQTQPPTSALHSLSESSPSNFQIKENEKKMESDFTTKNILSNIQNFELNSNSEKLPRTIEGENSCSSTFEKDIQFNQTSISDTEHKKIVDLEEGKNAVNRNNRNDDGINLFSDNDDNSIDNENVCEDNDEVYEQNLSNQNGNITSEDSNGEVNVKQIATSKRQAILKPVRRSKAPTRRRKRNSIEEEEEAAAKKEMKDAEALWRRQRFSINENDSIDTTKDSGENSKARKKIQKNCDAEADSGNVSSENDDGQNSRSGSEQQTSSRSLIETDDEAIDDDNEINSESRSKAWKDLVLNVVPQKKKVPKTRNQPIVEDTYHSVFGDQSAESDIHLLDSRINCKNKKETDNSYSNNNDDVKESTTFEDSMPCNKSEENSTEISEKKNFNREKNNSVFDNDDKYDYNMESHEENICTNSDDEDEENWMDDVMKELIKGEESEYLQQQTQKLHARTKKQLDINAASAEVQELRKKRLTLTMLQYLCPHKALWTAASSTAKLNSNINQQLIPFVEPPEELRDVAIKRGVTPTKETIQKLGVELVTSWAYNHHSAMKWCSFEGLVSIQDRKTQREQQIATLESSWLGKPVQSIKVLDRTKANELLRFYFPREMQRLDALTEPTIDDVKETEKLVDQTEGKMGKWMNERQIQSILSAAEKKAGKQKEKKTKKKNNERKTKINKKESDNKNNPSLVKLNYKVFKSQVSKNNREQQNDNKASETSSVQKLPVSIGDAPQNANNSTVISSSTIAATQPEQILVSSAIFNPPASSDIAVQDPSQLLTNEIDEDSPRDRKMTDSPVFENIKATDFGCNKKFTCMQQEISIPGTSNTEQIVKNLENQKVVNLRAENDANSNHCDDRAFIKTGHLSATTNTSTISQQEATSKPKQAVVKVSDASQVKLSFVFSLLR